jgi:predicted Holliday junction resolvase-like endonuclease
LSISLLDYLLLSVTVILLLILAYDKLTFYRRFEQWKKKELMRETSRIQSLIEEKYKAILESWKAREEERIRRDALERSTSVVMGKVAEQLAPLDFAVKLGINPKDARFIGSPIDYIVFKGLYDGSPEEILFVEVKSSRNAKLTKREKDVRKLIEECRVRWVKYELN